VNGVCKGKQAFRNDCVFTFKVPYENGTIEAVSYDESGREIGRRKLVSAGEETVLRAEPEESAVMAGHLTFVRLRYTDGNGETKPAERGTIQVTVEGGRLLGLGSACPYYERSYLDSECDTYYGEALAIVEAGEGEALKLLADDGRFRAETVVGIEASRENEHRKG
ncbi:MAG: DUF4982 domain-containing protein, partial [Oscillospiraceae bacterium]|nr:DUF4982 domain-containing protein [Oscillospiraceae bacterium]